MPMSSTISKQAIQDNAKLFEDLSTACAYSKALEGLKPDEEFIYNIYGHGMCGTDNTKAAIARYGNIHAVMTPKDLTDEQMVVFEFIIRDMTGDDEVLVFTDRDFEFAKKYAYSTHAHRVRR